MEGAALRIQAALRGRQDRRLVAASWEQCGFGPEAESRLLGAVPGGTRLRAPIRVGSENPYSVSLGEAAVAAPGACWPREEPRESDRLASWGLPRRPESETDDPQSTQDEPSAPVLSAVPVRPLLRMQSVSGYPGAAPAKSPPGGGEHPSSPPAGGSSPLFGALRKEPIRFRFGPDTAPTSL